MSHHEWCFRLHVFCYTLLHKLDFILQEKNIQDVPINNMLPANSMVGITETSSVNGLNSRQMMVFNLIRGSTVEQGISKQDMYASLKDRMTKVEFEYVFFNQHTKF